jgi:hypothetical protein
LEAKFDGSTGFGGSVGLGVSIGSKVSRATPEGSLDDCDCNDSFWDIFWDILLDCQRYPPMETAITIKDNATRIL